MEFTRASLSVLDEEEFRAVHSGVTLLAEDDTYLRVRQLGESQHLGSFDYDIRRYSSTEQEEGSDRLLDWFEVITTKVSLVEGALYVQGFQRGLSGKIRNGEHPKGGRKFDYDGNAGEPWLRVEWVLR